jgi:stage III sporulation protein AD
MELLAGIDWRGAFVPNVPVLEIILRGSIVYLGIFALFRVILMRQSGSVGMADLLVLVLVADAAQISPVVLAIVFKAVGISIVTKLSSDVCRDAGQSSVASGIELAGAFAALYIALPLFKTVMDMIKSLV